MTQHDDAIILRQILEHAEEALQIIKDKTRADVKDDRILNLALVRLLEIIGEAAGRVSKSRRETIPQIPWMEIVAMRNRLIHGYDQIDLNVVWDVIQNDLPPLVEELRKFLPI
jgi:uncharacterized protein with HEPN domain